MKKHILQFNISKGDDFYIAQGVDLPVVTQAKNLDELVVNINEAVELHLEGEDLASVGIAEAPSVLVNFELPAYA